MPDDALSGSPAELLARLERLPTGERTREELLRGVLEPSALLLPADALVSVSLLAGKDPSTAAASAPLALELDGEQYRRGAGPCLHAAATGEVTEVPDAAADPRWPGFLAVAVERGVLSTLSVPLRLGSSASGSLNVYAPAAHAFDKRARAAAARLALHASVAVGTARAYASVRTMAGHLAQALESRGTIEQAKGILMERYRMSAEQAFQALVQVSMGTNTKLREVADHLVRTGEVALR